MDLNDLAKDLMDKNAPGLPKGVGMTLILFDFGTDDGQICYASNAQRPDMYRALKGLLSHWESGNWKGDLN